MKRLLALLLVCLGADLRAGTFHCTWNFSDFTTGSLGVSQVQVQPIAPYGVNSNTFLTGDLLVKQTGTNTSLTISNLVNGRSYRVKFFGLTRPYGTNWVTTLTNNFDTNVTGLVNAVDYLAAPLQVDAATVAYSQVAADARFLRTNITQYVLSGTNVSFVTNGNTVTISSTASGSGSGSATNVFFIGATGETTWDQVGGSNRVSIVNVDGAKVTGSSLTNIPSLWVASIAALTNLPNVADGVVGYVDSYFGTNVWGGGKFKRSTGSSATINNGTVFAANGSGRWLRVDTGYATNVFLMEWFGVVPNGAIDSFAAAQATINATPTTEGRTILPPYNFAVGQTLWFTNRRSSYFGSLDVAKVRSSGYRNYPNPTSVIHWMGVSGGTNLVAYDSGHNTFAGFGLDTRIGLNNGDQYTNAAGLLFDVDMYPTHSTTTSANVFDGLYFRERHTNTTLVGMRIASYNWQNCEFFRWYDCYWQGGGWDLPQYWITTTNLGAFKGLQLGGNGGGANSFQHYMFNCGWDRWMYNIHSSGGNWVLDNPKSTAAGAAAFYLNGDHPSIIRFADCEGDRQFLISPGDTVTLIGNRIADAVQSGYTNLSPVDAVKLNAYGNYFQHEAYIPAITNSFTSTGSYDGAGNSFDTTNDALIASWKFNSAFNSRGDFGTLKDHNNIQSGPWKTPSATQETNIVYQSFTDGTASAMALTMMPSNGVFGVGSYLNNVHFGVYNPDLNKTSFQFGDSVINPRFKLLTSAGGLITELQLLGSNSVWMEFYSGSGSTATRLDITGASAVNKIHARTGSLKITGTNDTDLLTFGTDYKIKFPYDTNVEFVGPIHGNILRATNHVTWFTNNSFTSLDPTPLRYGQVSLVNSNGVMWQVTATTSGVLAWATTNLLPTTAAQIVGKFTGTPTGSLFLRDDGTLSAVAGSQIILSGTDGKLLYNNAGGVDFADWSTINSQGGTITTNNNTLLGGSFVLTGDGARGLTNLAIGAGLAVENGVLKTNGQTSGGGSSDTYGFGTNTVAANSWTNSGNHNFTGTFTGNGSGLSNVVATAGDPYTYETLTNFVRDWGGVANTYTDNCAALSNFFNYCYTNPSAQSFTLWVPPGIYYFTNAPWNANENGQVVIPEFASTQRKQITIEGPNGLIGFDGSNSSGTHTNGGQAVFLATYTNANANFIASANWTNTDVINHANYVRFNVRNMVFRTPDYSGATLLNLRNVAQTRIEDSSFETVSKLGSLSNPPLSNSCGIYMPAKDLANLQILDRVQVTGFYYGIRFGEHAWVPFAQIVGCYRGAVFESANMANTFGRLVLQGCGIPLFWTAGAPIAAHSVLIERNSYSPSDWRTNTVDIYDFSSAASGFVNVEIKDNGSSTRNNKLRRTGAENLAIKIIANKGEQLFFGTSSSDIGTRGIQSLYVDDAVSAGFASKKARGTTAAMTAVAATDTAAFQMGFYDGSDFQYPTYLRGVVENTVSSGVVPSGLAFGTGTNGTSRSERARITSWGQMVVGSTVQTNAHLSVVTDAARGGTNVSFRLDQNGSADIAQFRANFGQVKARWDTNGNAFASGAVNATNGFAIATITVTTGAGSPESVLAAPVGSLYLRTDGGAGTTLYVKESGTGNTGWAAK